MTSGRREQIVWWVFAFIVVGATVLRVAHLGSHRFHVDEALFSSYGLAIATGRDMLLAMEQVDKPPLFFYILALSFRAFGKSETAAAIPNLVASVGSVALVFYLCRRLYGRGTALIAAALMAVSPFNVAYAYTAFIDPTMVGCLLLALALAERRSFFAAGLTAGLLPALKVQGILFWPVVAAFAVLGLAAAREKPWRWARAAGLGLLGAVVPLAVVALWSYLRPNQVPFLDLAAANNPLVPSPPASYAARLGDWWSSSLQFIAGPSPANYAMLLGVPVLLAWDILALLLGRGRPRAAWVDLIVAAFAAFFLAWHTYFDLPAWDRYMLGIVPFGAILLARALTLPWQALSLATPELVVRPATVYSLGGALVLFLAVAMFEPVRDGLHEAIALGWSGLGGPATYQGIDAVADYFKGNAHAGALIYDYKTLSWHYKYYLFGEPYRVIWFDDSYLDSFRLSVLDHRDREQYIVLASWQNNEKVRALLEGKVLRLVEVYRTHRPDGSVSFTIYRIEPRQ